MRPPACALPPPRLATEARRRRPLISLTPLIDVVFILLVFFMLASSFLEWRAIELDAPARAGSASSMDGAMLVEIRPGGVRLAGEALTPEALAERMRERLASRPEQRVLVKPAAGVALQETVAVLDLLAGQGVSALSVIRD
jgi:biopolymer transport protein ExbD